MATRKMLYRVPEAVEALGIPRSRLYDLMADGRIESVKVGKSRLIPHEALEAFVAELRREASGEHVDVPA